MCTNQPEERPASCSCHLSPWPKERSIIAVAITHIYIHMYKYTQTQHTHMLAYRGLLVKIHRACSALLPKFSSLGIILSLVMPRGGSDVPYYISTHLFLQEKEVDFKLWVIFHIDKRQAQLGHRFFPILATGNIFQTFMFPSVSLFC